MRKSEKPICETAAISIEKISGKERPPLRNKKRENGKYWNKGDNSNIVYMIYPNCRFLLDPLLYIFSWTTMPTLVSAQITG